MPDTPATDIPSPTGWRDALAAMARLAVPVATVQVGLMLMGVVDTLMVGRLRAADIAAVAMGNLYFYATAIFGVGVLMALDPLVAQAVGARDEAAIARAVQRGLLIATGLSLLAMLLLLFSEPVLRALGQPADVVPLAAAYARSVIPGMLPFYVFVVLRQTLQARHRVAPIVLAIVASNLVNVVLNWVLIFGHFGFEARGVVGAGIATMLSRWFMPLSLLAFSWREIRGAVVPWRADTWDRAATLRMLLLGAPIGITMWLEYGVFAIAGLMMGWIGTVALAGHQVAINLASLTFMVPLGVSAAAAVMVGNAVGRGDMPGARRAAGAALACGIGFMALSALAMLVLPGFFARLYTSDVAVAAVAASLIPIAGVFQVFDGTQVVSIGILRGTGDTRMPMLINILGFWLVGLSVSWYLGMRLQWGPAGLWWGLTLGLVLVAALLIVRVRSRLRKDIARILIDADNT